MTTQKPHKTNNDAREEGPALGRGGAGRAAAPPPGTNAGALVDRAGRAQSERRRAPAGGPRARAAVRTPLFSHQAAHSMSRGDSCAYQCAGCVLHCLNVLDFCFGVSAVLAGVLVLIRWHLSSAV